MDEQLIMGLNLLKQNIFYQLIQIQKFTANSFYKTLTEISGQRPGWNFHKYLISKEGKVQSFDTNVEPDSEELISNIAKLL